MPDPVVAPNTPLVPEVKAHKMNRLILIVLTVLTVGALVAGVFFFMQKNSPSFRSPIPQGQSNQQSSASARVSPSSVPFEEITIPYLRSRQYSSKLGELERVDENSSYTSYLTSYSSDGLRINGLLTQPKGTMPPGGWPAIVFIHGYIPPAQYQTLNRYVDHVDYLASNGFVVFKIDLRGHGESEGEPGGAYYSSEYVIDTLNAYVALQASDFVNPRQIGMWGHSMAGNVVSRAVAAKPEISAAVIWAGAGYSYKDLREYGIQDASYQPQQNSSERIRKRQQLINIYGQPDQGNPFWQTVAPTSYLNDLKGAIQLNHAVDDDVVSVEYSRNLSKLLAATNVTYEYHEYQSGGHNITGGSFTQAMQNSVNFFKKYLTE